MHVLRIGFTWVNSRCQEYVFFVFWFSYFLLGLSLISRMIRRILCCHSIKMCLIHRSISLSILDSRGKMNISFFIALLLIFRSCGIFFLIFVGFLNVLLDYEFLVCLFHQCFFNCVWVNVAWQPWQNNFLLFRFDVK